jgi:hypothetical protein
MTLFHTHKYKNQFINKEELTFNTINFGLLVLIRIAQIRTIGSVSVLSINYASPNPRSLILVKI